MPTRDDVFREAMAGVEPLKNRLPVREHHTAPTPGQLQRREAAAGEQLEPNPSVLPAGEVAQRNPNEIIECKKEGVQRSVLRKLKRGHYPVEASLDLHHLSVREARQAVYRFLVTCRERGCRCVVIVHGRGEHSATPARLKSYVVHWMQETADVIAYASAPPRAGGAGALYVLLRKNGPAMQQV